MTENKEKIIVYDETKKITPKEAEWLRQKFLHNLIVGSELETQNHNREFRKKLIETIKPNREYGCYNPTGVHSVVSDGSLHSSENVEIIYAGNNFSTEEMIKQLTFIENTMLNMNKYGTAGELLDGFYTDERTGQHMSILQVKPFRVPELVARNIYQIARIFCSNLAHLTGTGIGNTPLRSNSRQYAQLPISTAKNKNFQKLINDVNNETGDYGKYSFLNIKKNVCSKDGEWVDDLFFELRVADRIMSPTIEAIIMQLLKAITMKACNVSTKGLILAKQEFWNDQKEIYNILQNKDKKQVTEGIGKELTEQTNTLLKFLRPELDEIDKALYPTLLKLSKKPLWVASKVGKDKNWKEIEKEYKKEYNKHNPNNTDKQLLMLITTNDEFLNENTKEETIKTWSELLGIKETTTEQKINKLNFEWNNKEKCFIRRKE